MLTPVEPANDLERWLAAVVEDEAARPSLWQALHTGELVLPVVANEATRAEGPNLQFLCAPASDQPLVFGFATEERAVLLAAAAVVAVAGCDRVVLGGDADLVHPLVDAVLEVGRTVTPR